MNAVAETEELTKRFGHVQAVDGLNLTIATGEVFGLLGPNGAGKTTTLRLLLGLVRPDDGRACLWGEEVRPGAPVLRRVGAVVERPAFYPYLSGRDNLAVLAAAHGLGRGRHGAVAEALRRAHLDHAADRGVGGYSAGMRQRLALAAALLGDPDLIVLDEPTSALDPEGIAELRASIVEFQRDGKTLLLSSHLLAEVEQVCTTVAIIHRGRLVVQAPTQELLGPVDRQLIRFATSADAERATAILGAAGFPVESPGPAGVPEIVVSADDAQVVLRSLSGAEVLPLEVRPRVRTLESVFLALVGEEAVEGGAAAVKSHPRFRISA